MKLTFLFATVTILMSNLLIAQVNKTEILVIGTPHFSSSNYMDKKFNVLSKESQAELDKVAEAIKSYNPSKIFVEINQNDQVEFDSLYKLYLENRYYSTIEKIYKKDGVYYSGEISQLGFRAAKKCLHRKIYCVDVDNDENLDSVMSCMTLANQKNLLQEAETEIQSIIKRDSIDKSTKNIKQLLIANNNISDVQKHCECSYLSILNRAGNKQNFSGAFMTSEMYRRNIYIYSLIQKNITAEDKRVLVIIGACHLPILKYLITLDNKVKFKGLSEIYN